MPVVECPICGAAVAAESTVCDECGSPLTPSGKLELYLRKYSPARDLGLLAGLALAGAGIVLVAVEQWLWAILALVLAAVVFLVRWEAGRRRTATAFARLSAQRRVVGARSRGQIELFRLRRELAELQAERSQGYQDLGRATHAGDDAAASAATAHVNDVLSRIEAKEAEVAVLLEEMRERIRRAQAERATDTLGTNPTGEAEVPEPFPPPDEGTPPEPARVPEPFPQPVPEPSPDDPLPEPEHPPAPETRRRKASRTSNT